MSETPNTAKCPRCGASVAPDAPEGLCPRCLMALNLVTQTEAGAEIGPGGTRVVPPDAKAPPSVLEIAAHFPQLDILECLGRGGMGVVYQARQPRLNRLVALKILAGDKQRDPKFAERFQREAQALARLNHPNIVAVHDFGETNGMFYLVMEFVDGMNLRQLLRSRKLAPEEAIAIVPRICEALQFAHEQGIVHRDIKPENILLDKQGRVKIADFGIAKLMGDQPPGEPLTAEQQSIGTPHYMAPEQVEKPATVDHRADIYSLGVVFYELLTGELPLGKFDAPSQKVRMDVRLDEVVLRALEKEPARRYQHASQVKSDVETIATTPPVLGTASGGIGKPPPVAAAADAFKPGDSAPEFSMKAILGAACIAGCFGGLVLLGFLSTVGAQVGHGTTRLVLTLLSAGALAVSVGSAFGASILGWLAITQIRNSKGRIHGLGLAVFDLLLFPLLLAGGLVFCFWLLILEASGPYPRDETLVCWLLLSLATIALIASVVIRRVWRAVSEPPGGAGLADGTGHGAAPRKSTPAQTWIALGTGLVLLLSVVLGVTRVVNHAPPPVSPDPSLVVLRDSRTTGLAMVYFIFLGLAILALVFSIVARRVWGGVNKPAGSPPGISPNKPISAEASKMSAGAGRFSPAVRWTLTSTGLILLAFAIFSVVGEWIHIYDRDQAGPSSWILIALAGAVGVAVFKVRRGFRLVCGIIAALSLAVGVRIYEGVMLAGTAASADVRTRLFEADAALLDQYVPADSRLSQPGNYFTAVIPEEALSRLVRTLPAPPGVMSDMERRVSGWPVGGMVQGSGGEHKFTGVSRTAMANGWLGLRKSVGRLEFRVDESVVYVRTWPIYQPGDHIKQPGDQINERSVYQGAVPASGALVFIFPVPAVPDATKYLVETFEFSTDMFLPQPVVSSYGSNDQFAVVSSIGSNAQFVIYHDGMLPATISWDGDGRSRPYRQAGNLPIGKDKVIPFEWVSTRPNVLMIGAEGFNLHDGRVVLLEKDGTPRQLSLWPGVIDFDNLSAFADQVHAACGAGVEQANPADAGRIAATLETTGIGSELETAALLAGSRARLLEASNQAVEISARFKQSPAANPNVMTAWNQNGLRLQEFHRLQGALRTNSAVRTNLEVRFAAAEDISRFPDRDSAMAELAGEAAAVAEIPLVKQSLRAIQAFPTRDTAASGCAQSLEELGLRTEALAICKSITAFTTRDEALTALARGAAKSAEPELTRDCVTAMTSFTAHDDAVRECIDLLVAAGQRTEALDLARTIKQFTLRDEVLKELAK